MPLEQQDGHLQDWSKNNNEATQLTWEFANHIIWLLSNKFSYIDLNWNIWNMQTELDFFRDSIIRHLNLADNSVIRAYLLNYIDVNKINKLESISAYEYLHIFIEIAYITSLKNIDSLKLEKAFIYKLNETIWEDNWSKKDPIKLLLELIKSREYFIG